MWGDDRGHFREWYKMGDFEEAGVDFHATQANLSMSSRNVVRGLHYSLAPEGQAKVVTCAYGELDDVIVDIRVGSPTFGRVEVVHLAAGEGRSVLVPVGAAHGYCPDDRPRGTRLSLVVALQRGARIGDSPIRRRDQRDVASHRRANPESQGRERPIPRAASGGQRAAALLLGALYRRGRALVALTK